MGWGGCNVPVSRMRRRPKGMELPPDSDLRKLPHCREFYWNIGSAISKVVCLSAFMAFEWPRRIHAYALYRPEPRPVFTCAKAGGFRVCACGHHFYDHKELIMGSPPPLPPSDSVEGGSNDTPRKKQKLKPSGRGKRRMREAAREVKPVLPMPRQRRRRWYWPF